MTKIFRLLLNLLIVVELVGCTSPSYPGVDKPTYNITETDRQIIDYIDQRLSGEYYWLDEVHEKSHLFNRNVKWSDYLAASLRRLSTNEDDGYVNGNGQRVFYSYIRSIENQTRATTTGFGIGLYFTVVKIGENEYGFVVDNVYAESPAAEAGILRGDIITRINNSAITSSNYNSLFNSVHYNTATSLRLGLRRQIVEEQNNADYAVTIERGVYESNPVVYSDVIVLESGERIGYLVYSSFDSDYDEELLDALSSMATEGVDYVVLDLRCNRGGNVDSAVTLCSALLGGEHQGDILCTLERNPRNTSSTATTSCELEDVGIDVGIESLVVVCSNNTASASELVITGLRGLDIPVTLVGTTTEGKNCGMDVTRRKIGDLYLEFAPITFMCYNAKGFGDWGEGIGADIDLTTENSLGISDQHYPLPRCAWGDIRHDIGLVAAIAAATGKGVNTNPQARKLSSQPITPAYSIPMESIGIRFDVE